jgi:hypothetical protein
MSDPWLSFKPLVSFVHPGTGDLVLVLSEEQSKRLKAQLTEEQWAEVMNNV